MAKIDKSFQWRMEGMHFAYNIAKNKGVDALLQEIKRRGLLKVDITCSPSKMQEQWNAIKDNMLNNIMACTLWTLWNEFGFGKVRLSRFKNAFDRHAQNAVDLDYLGEHYVMLYEYAEELNRQHGIELDVDLIKQSQIQLDSMNNYTGRCKLSRVLEVLEEYGFDDAAECLRNKIFVRE